MSSFKILQSLAFSAICLLAQSPALSQTSIPIFPIVDFESQQVQSTLSNYGGSYADNGEFALDSITPGNSRLTTFATHEDPDSMQWVPGRRDSSLWAFKLGYQLGTVKLGCGGTCTYEPHVGLAQGFSSEYDPLDLTGATHVTFWAKGDFALTVDVSIGMRDSVAARASYSQKFVIDTTWKKYSIELKASPEFKLPTYVTPVPFVAAKANSVGFSISKDNNPTQADNALYLDDIEIVNWVYTPYVDPAGISDRNGKSQRNSGLRARISGDVAFVQVPAAFFGKTGVIEAMDARGRKVGRAAFGPQAMDVSLKVPGASAKSAGLYFRALLQ
ncbi:MAG: hypothetical protein ABIW76_06280 [Fibrobacteria bacterium]